MLSYVRQVAICETVRETIRQALGRSNDWQAKLKASLIPTTDAILRAVSALSSLDTEEKLKDFMIDYILVSLRLTDIEKEHLNLIS